MLNYETINHDSTEEEIMISKQLIKEIEKVVNYYGYKEDCSYSDTLSQLCKFKNFYDYTDIESSVNLITFKMNNDKGYLWFTYSQQLIVDEKIKIKEENTLCLIQYEQKDNKWVEKNIYFSKNK